MKGETIAWLRRLLKEGVKPASSVPKTVQGELEGFVRTGVVEWARSGRGSMYRVGDRAALEAICAVDPLEHATSESAKAVAVARTGDAHQGRADRILLLLSAAAPPAVWSGERGQLDIADCTRRFGVASLVVRPADDWVTEQPLLLVENLELLYHPDRLHHIGTILYYPGWLSGMMLRWLRDRQRAPEYVVCADFDPVGLTNYARARKMLGHSVKLFVPEDLERLIASFGKPERLVMNKRLLGNLEVDNDPSLQRVLNLVLRYGKGLDQEVLLLGYDR